MTSGGKPYSPVKTVLLTGAGFTKTFGGYLGSEMWAAILRQPELQEDDTLRRKLLDVPLLKFEMFYEEVETLEHYSEEQRVHIRAALQQSYKEMDASLRNKNKPESAPVGKFLEQFAGLVDKRSRGFIFTLNQDLFVERFFVSYKNVRLPGIETRAEWFNGNINDWDYALRLPTAGQIDTFKDEFWQKGLGPLMYVKLHGSHLWKSENGSNAMVIGYGKKGRLEKEPLLDWYLHIFNEVLNFGDTNLVIIGYGFGDDHINDLIGNAVKNSRLKLTVICPTVPSAFRDQVMKAPAPKGFRNSESLADIIWQGLCRYYPSVVSEFYHPSGSALTPQGDAFFRSLGLL